MESTRLHRVVGLHHIQLAMPPSREEAAEAFYSGVLGLERIPKPPSLEARGGCWFRTANLELHLGVDDSFTPARKAHPAFIVEGLDALQDRLEAAGHKIVWDTQLGQYRRFYVNDPFGNRLEFVESTGRSSGG
jgi:catechol 2,3-dioxygenase-like lactoylglutathione lyase family enzyme